MRGRARLLIIHFERAKWEHWAGVFPAIIRCVSPLGYGLDFAKEWLPDVVIIGRHVKAGEDGIRAIAKLRALDPAPQIIVVAKRHLAPEAELAIKSGACGYLNDRDDVLIQQVARAALAMGPLDRPRLRVFDGGRASHPRTARAS